LGTKRESIYEGVWVLIVSNLCAIAALRGGPLNGFVAAASGVDREDGSALGYLRQYAADGASGAVALLVVCVIAATVWKRYSRWTAASFFTAWVMLTPQIFFALAILWRCLNLVSPTQASALLKDKTMQSSAMWTGYLLGVALLLALSIASWPSSRRPGTGDSAQADSDQRPLDSSP
jgi:hypothetical protein